MKLDAGLSIDGCMKRKQTKLSVLKTAIFICLLTGLFFGCSTLNIITGKSDIYELGSPPADLQEEKLEPGLSVLYFYGFYRNLAQMPRGEKRVLKVGIPGKPIPYLNHQFGEGEVFDSGRAKGVGMQMDGFIRFEKPGDYVFQARTNDGFRLFIDEHRIINDPAVHSDRLSETAIVKVSEPGWYPMRVRYFQRKGTAALQLFWQEPGKSQQVPVPAEAYAHLPG